MIHSAGSLHHRAVAELLVSRESKSQPQKSQAFRAEFSDQLASARKSPGNPSLPPALPPGQENASWRQNSDGQGISTSNSTATPPSGLQGLVITFPSATYPTKASATEPSAQATPSFDDTYWANQPAAVQQLRGIESQTQRTQVAAQLASQGYSIDVPIMVWGWDPQITTAERQAAGYTWVPSAMQQPTAVAPGLTFAGSASYDAKHPPAGSIPV